MLVPISPPAGMFRNGTQYETSGRWYDGNLIRWENDRMKPIGGWVRVPTTITMSGIARGGIAFEDNAGNSYLLIGTNTKLYLFTGGVIFDVTPTGFGGGLVGSIFGPGYGAGYYGRDVYGLIRTALAFTPDGSGTGAPAPSLIIQASTWQMDTFGNSVIAVCSSDRNIYQYNPPGTGPSAITKISGSTVGDPAPTPIAAPTALAVMTTNEDYLLAIGAGGDNRRIQWPDIGTSTAWTPTTTNSAGGIDLNTQGKAMAGARVGAQNLVWTDADAHLIQYVGPPGIYGPVRIGSHCGLVGPRAWAVTDVAYWMGIGGFFVYNGVVTPMPCDVQDYVWRLIDWTQAAKIYASTNTRYNEVIWFFPSVAGTVALDGSVQTRGPDGTVECDSYVIYNYKQGVWYFGIHTTMARTTWIDRDVYPFPGAVGPNGVLYQHDQPDYRNDTLPRAGTVRIKSGFNEIQNGDQIAYVTMMIPDLMRDDGATLVQANVISAFTPDGPATQQTIDLTPNAEGYVPLRMVGRQFALEVVNVSDGDWSLGKPRLEVRAGGGR